MVDDGNDKSDEDGESYPDSLPDLVEIEPEDEENRTTKYNERPSCIAEQAEKRSLFGPEGFEGDLKRSYWELKTNKAKQALDLKQTLEDLD